MKKFFTGLSLLILTTTMVYNQFISNNIDLCFGYRYNFASEQAIGFDPDLVKEIPPRVDGTKGISIKALSRIENFVDIGLGYQHNQLNSWELLTPFFTDKRSYSTNTICVILGLSTPFKDQGILNRCSFHLQLSPYIGVLNYKSISGTEDGTETLKDNYKMTGLELSLNANLNVSNTFGLSFQIGHNFNHLDSGNIEKDNLSYSYIEAGLYLRLFKNKRLYI